MHQWPDQRINPRMNRGVDLLDFPFPPTGFATLPFSHLGAPYRFFTSLQSISHRVNKSIDESINQLTKQHVDESTKAPIGESTNPPSNRPTNQPPKESPNKRTNARIGPKGFTIYQHSAPAGFDILPFLAPIPFCFYHQSISEPANESIDQ